MNIDYQNKSCCKDSQPVLGLPVCQSCCSRLAGYTARCEDGSFINVCGCCIEDKKMSHSRVLEQTGEGRLEYPNTPPVQTLGRQTKPSVYLVQSS